MRDQLIKAVRELRIRDRLLQDDTSLCECLKIVERMEAGFSTSPLLKNTNYTQAAHGNGNTHTVRQFDSKFSQKKANSTATKIHSCFRCGTKLHFANSNNKNDYLGMRKRAKNATKSLFLQKCAVVRVQILLIQPLWKKVLLNPLPLL